MSHFAAGRLEAIPVSYFKHCCSKGLCELFNQRKISGGKSSSHAGFTEKQGYAITLQENHCQILFTSISLYFSLSLSQQLPSGYGTYPSATHQAAAHHSATSSLPRSAPGTLGWPRSNAANATSSSSSSSSSSQQIQQRISIPPHASQGTFRTNAVP